MAIMPELRLRAAWSTGPLSASPAYVDVPCKILGGNIHRGRAGKLALVEAGTMSLTLLDSGGALDASWSGSSVYPYNPVGKKIQLLGNVLGTDYTLATMFINSIGRRPKDMGSSVEVEIQASDGFRRFQKKRISAEFEAELSGLRMVRLADARGWPGAGLYVSAGNRDIDFGTSVMAGVALDLRSAREHMAHVEASEMGLCYIAADGTLVWRSRDALTVGVYAEPQGFFGGVGGIHYVDIMPELSDEDVFNEVVASRVDGIEYGDEDTDSADDYGESTFPDSRNLLLTTDLEVQDYRDAALEMNKDPLYRFRQIEVLASDDTQPASCWAAVLGHEIGYRERVTYEERENGHVLVQDLNLQQVDHEFSFRDELYWTWTADFEVADPLVDLYWDLSLDLLGSETVAAH